MACSMKTLQWHYVYYLEKYSFESLVSLNLYNHPLKLPGDIKETETVKWFKDVEYLSWGDADGTHRFPHTATHSASSQGYVCSSPCALL